LIAQADDAIVVVSTKERVMIEELKATRICVSPEIVLVTNPEVRINRC